LDDHNVVQPVARRNDARESKKMIDPQVIARRMVAAVEDWKEIQKPKMSTVAKPCERWINPDPGWLKVNVHGAYRAADDLGGGGMVIRDHHGGFVSGVSHLFLHLLDAEGAELLAFRRGLILARDRQVQHVVLEMDSTGVAAKLLRKEQDRSLHGPLMEDLKLLLRSFNDHSVRSVRRSANVTAHILAKEGCENKLCNVWHGVEPW
jgi:ribonuclease HI